MELAHRAERRWHGAGIYFMLIMCNPGWLCRSSDHLILGGCCHARPCVPSGCRAPSPAVGMLLTEALCWRKGLCRNPHLPLGAHLHLWLGMKAHLLVPIRGNAEGPAPPQHALGQPRPVLRLHHSSERGLPCPVLLPFLPHRCGSWERAPINFSHLLFTSEPASQGMWLATILQGVWNLRLQVAIHHAIFFFKTEVNFHLTFPFCLLKIP